MTNFATSFLIFEKNKLWVYHKCSLFQAKSLGDVDPSSPSQYISPFRKPLESIGNNVHSPNQPGLSAHVSISRNIGVISSPFPDFEFI